MRIKNWFGGLRVNFSFFTVETVAGERGSPSVKMPSMPKTKSFACLVDAGGCILGSGGISTRVLRLGFSGRKYHTMSLNVRYKKSPDVITKDMEARIDIAIKPECSFGGKGVSVS